MKRFVVIVFLCCLFNTAWAEDFHVHLKIRHQDGAKVSTNAGVVLWLTPASGPVHAVPLQHVQLLQKNKQFQPHLLVIPIGTKVNFPNQDPFFHNVFSLYKGKRFDLGLYEAGSSKTVEFDRPGVSFIFCNIHPDMSAAVVALETPYYAVSNEAGDLLIHDVPPGTYHLAVWYERSSPEALAKLARDVVMPGQRELLNLEVAEVVPETMMHKNKYGADYDKSKGYGPE